MQRDSPADLLLNQEEPAKDHQTFEGILLDESKPPK